MLAVGDDELGPTIGTQETCPHCGQAHDVTSSNGYEPGTNRVT